MLHREKQITIGGEVFNPTPPFMETMILVSEKISEIPKHEYKEDDMLFGALANARHYRPMVDAIAILVLGANNLEREGKKRLFGLLKPRRVNELARVSKLISTTKTNREIVMLFRELLEGLQVGDFFVLSSILREINLMDRTTTPVPGR